MNDFNYKKYLKYKIKYLNLKQNGFKEISPKISSYNNTLISRTSQQYPMGLKYNNKSDDDEIVSYDDEIVSLVVYG